MIVQPLGAAIASSAAWGKASPGRRQDMLTIYGVYRSRATRVIWTADELGLTWRHVPVIQGYRLKDPHAADAPVNTLSPSFLAVNPSGQIPAIDDGGFVLNESLAIPLYLARKHGGPIAPKDVGEEGRMMALSLFAATECEPKTIQILYNRIGKPPAERDEALALQCIADLARPFATLEKLLSQGGGYCVGGRFTVADICVAEVMRYAQAAPELMDRHPAIKAWLAACQARPAFKEMMRRREAEPA
jgi:glutathione S-transferase